MSAKSKQKGKSKKGKTPFHFKALDWLCVAVGIIASVITLFIDHDHPQIYIIASILMLNCGVLEVILGVNGRRSNYIFALINAAASIFVAWIDQFFGNTLINIYYIPLCIVGFYVWGKHRDSDKYVIARKLTVKQVIIATLIFALLSAGLIAILDYFGGHSVILDGMATILIIFASILGALRFREQWLIWIIADILMLAMWINSNNPAILTMRTFYIFSSIYGYINWRKLIKNPRNKKAHV